MHTHTHSQGYLFKHSSAGICLVFQIKSLLPSYVYFILKEVPFVMEKIFSFLSEIIALGKAVYSKISVSRGKQLLR